MTIIFFHFFQLVYKFLQLLFPSIKFSIALNFQLSQGFFRFFPEDFNRVATIPAALLLPLMFHNCLALLVRAPHIFIMESRIRSLQVAISPAFLLHFHHNWDMVRTPRNQIRSCLFLIEASQFSVAQESIELLFDYVKPKPPI